MLTRADLLVLWSRSVDHDGPNHPLTQRLHAAYEATPPEPTNNDREEQDPWPEESPASSSR